MSVRYIRLSLVPLLFLACTEDVVPNRAYDTPSTGGSEPTSESGGSPVGSGGSSSAGGNAAVGTVSGGTSSGGMSSGGSTSGGNTSGGNTSGGNTSGGNTSGGNTSGGNTSGGNTSGGNTSGGNTSGGNTSGGASTGGSATGGTDTAQTGGATTAGAAGDGSGGTTPITLPYGFAPTTASRNDAVQAYDEWKAVHLEDCGDGVYRVPWENDRLDATVSEGVGYGMLLSVAYDDQTAFDGLFAYYNLALDDWGLMHWLRYGCDAHWDTLYNEYPENAAADADLDVAMALTMAGCKWGGDYLSDAARIINALEESTIGWDGDVAFMQPGDSAFFENNDCINYSYFAPGYYRAFAEVVPESADFWNQLADDTYVVLERASDSTTGLVRNWGSSSGGSVYGCTFDYSDDYGADATRTPWRIGVDYLWWGNTGAKGWLDHITAWLMTQSLPDLGLWYHLDGTLDTSYSDYDRHTAMTLGPWAVAAMAYSQEAVDALTTELVGVPTTDGSWDADYYARSLRALTLLTLTGQFTRCGGDSQVEE